MTTLSIVVTTYNRPDALQAVLRGFLGQRDLDFELIVADDGSTEDTAEVVRSFGQIAPFRVDHAWQPDRGFRAAAVRNLAVARASGEYIAFVDGDCVPTRSLSRNLKRLARPGWFVCGSRLLLSETATSRLLADGSSKPIHAWTWLDWIAARSRGDVNRLLPLLPFPTARPKSSAAWHRCRTFCVGAWRSDLLAVNGFDESYEGWGLEDSDLAIRLLNDGLKLQHVRHGLAVTHLWHPENPRDNLDRNEQLLAELQASGRTRARRGIAESGTSTDEPIRRTA